MSSHRLHPVRERLGRRFVRRLGWAVGAPLAVFRFLRREIPLEEVDAAEAPVRLPADEPDPAHREQEQATGPVIHRLYSASIRAPTLSSERLMAIVAADPNVIAPVEVVRFERKGGGRGALRKGEQLVIRMAGPWNAPVEVTRRWRNGFRLAATRGHPQLGQVEVRTRDRGDDIVMEIQTRERAAGRGFRLLQRVGLVRRMQTYTWAEMLENAAQLAGGRRPERIAVRSWAAGAGVSVVPARVPDAVPETEPEEGS
jgi:hypothetical protein